MDYGASSGRGIVGSFDGERLLTQEVGRFDNAPVMLAGRLVWEITSLYANILPTIAEAKTRVGGIDSIGVDTWGVDYGYIDNNGHLLSLPVNYRDDRTRSIRGEFFDRIPWDELYGRTGIQDLAFNTIYQLYCDVARDPHIVGAAKRMLFIPDLLNYLLSGVEAMEYTIASTGAILDAKTRRIADDLLRRVGFDTDLLAPLVEPSTVIGKLTGEMRTVAGKDVNVVATASHDTASAVLATPAEGENFAYVSCGTWSLLGVELPSPMITPETQKYGFTNEGGAGGKIRFLKNIAGLWLKQQSRKQWIREGRQFTHDELSDAAMASTPHKFLIDPDDDSFTPPGDMPSRISEFLVKTGQGAPSNEGEITRAIFDSLALRYRWSIEKIRELTGNPISEIHIVGGGVRENVFMQLAADACGIPVIAGPSEATAMGNICSQLIAAGELGSIAEARQLVRRSTELAVYEPHGDRAAWDGAYERFLSILEK